MTSAVSDGAAERMTARTFSRVDLAGPETEARYSSTVLGMALPFPAEPGDLRFFMEPFLDSNVRGSAHGGIFGSWRFRRKKKARKGLSGVDATRSVGDNGSSWRKKFWTRNWRGWARGNWAACCCAHPCTKDWL